MKQTFNESDAGRAGRQARRAHRQDAKTVRFEMVMGHVENPMAKRTHPSAGSPAQHHDPRAPKPESGRPEVWKRKKSNKRTFTGTVVSDKMDKTVTVLVSTRQLHPLYKKYITRSKKYKAHDEANDAHEGDTVRIVEGQTGQQRQAMEARGSPRARQVGATR
jgi:small subunit ribosomal protein S17